MREKNGRGRKLLNPPESEGHLAVHAAHFIPATTDGGSGRAAIQEKDNKRFTLSIFYKIHFLFYQ